MSLARRTDPASSHVAAAALQASPSRSVQKAIVLRLLNRHPGYTYQELFSRYEAECRRKVRPLIIQYAPSLMKRLNDWGQRHGEKICRITGKTATRWVAREEL